MRVGFLGSPPAAVPTMERLADSFEIPLVITQPDRPKGRSRIPTPTAVKTKAGELGLPVSEPRSSDELVDALRQFGPLDVAVVVAYGRILSPAALNVPRNGMVNVHFSLLPRWRGAAPVNRAIMAGDTMSGVTIIKIDEGLDTGPVITAQAVDIRREETATELTDRLARLGAELMVDSLSPYLEGDLQPIAQTDEGAEYAHKLERSDRPIDPGDSASDISSQVRGLAETPAATLMIDGESHKILAVARHEADLDRGQWRTIEGKPVIGIADGALELVRIQAPGGKPMPGTDWVRGRQDRQQGTIG